MRDARTRRQELAKQFDEQHKQLAGLGHQGMLAADDHAARDERDTWLWPVRRILAAAGRDLLAIRGLARHCEPDAYPPRRPTAINGQGHRERGETCG